MGAAEPAAPGWSALSRPVISALRAYRGEGGPASVVVVAMLS
jgi:hypothetical protein